MTSRTEAPLSWAQERLLFLHRLDPTGQSYHRPLALGLHGPLATGALQAALVGAKEIGFTVLSISISLVAVFIPILMMGGIIGRLFREFAVTL